MGERTNIVWADHTFNPWIGCSRVSPGCQHCYAEQLDRRVGGYGRPRDVPVRLNWGKHAPRYRTSAANWREPLRWERDAAAGVLGPNTGRARHLVFCASLADVFEDRPDLVQHREDLFDLIQATPHLDWLLLTKRPQNVRPMTRFRWFHGLPENVWVGTTVEDQQRADERIPHLLEIPATVRFLSCEPLLGPVDITPWISHWHHGYIGWVIVGGESGPGHRPLDLDHARQLVQQCQRAAVPVFFKQVGGRTPTAGGDLLDGARMKQFPPEVRA